MRRALRALRALRAQLARLQAPSGAQLLLEQIRRERAHWERTRW